MGFLRDKAVVVSGSTRGIGKAMARHFIDLGACVVVNGRNESRVADTVDEFQKLGGTAIGSTGDVSRFSNCNQLIDDCISAYGRLDYLVNNAGISMEGDVADLAPQVIQKVIETNLIGACYLTKAAIPHLKRSQGGVVFISSCASFKGIPGYSAYCASKMALNGFAESLKLELQPFDVYVGIAQVGFTKNDVEKKILGRSGHWVPQPERPFVQPESQESVARQIAMMLQNRKANHVFGTIGKAASLLNRFAPSLYELILRRHYQKSNAAPAVESIDNDHGLPGQNFSNS